MTIFTIEVRLVFLPEQLGPPASQPVSGVEPLGNRELKTGKLIMIISTIKKRKTKGDE